MRGLLKFHHAGIDVSVPLLLLEPPQLLGRFLLTVDADNGLHVGNGPKVHLDDPAIAQRAAQQLLLAKAVDDVAAHRHGLSYNKGSLLQKRERGEGEVQGGVGTGLLPLGQGVQSVLILHPQVLQQQSADLRLAPQIVVPDHHSWRPINGARLTLITLLHFPIGKNDRTLPTLQQINATFPQHSIQHPPTKNNHPKQNPALTNQEREPPNRNLHDFLQNLTILHPALQIRYCTGIFIFSMSQRTLTARVRTLSAVSNRGKAALPLEVKVTPVITITHYDENDSLFANGTRKHTSNQRKFGRKNEEEDTSVFTEESGNYERSRFSKVEERPMARDVFLRQKHLKTMAILQQQFIQGQPSFKPRLISKPLPSRTPRPLLFPRS